MQRGVMLFFLLLLSQFLPAQDSTIYRKVAEIKKSDPSIKNIAELKQVLSSTVLTDADKLLVQVTVINQYQALQLWDTCLNYCQALIALAHKQHNEFAEATFYKHIGNTYYFVPNRDKAAEYWIKCIEISEANNFTLLLEQCYHNIGATYLEKGVDFDLAEMYFNKAIRMGIINQSQKTPDNIQHYRLLATTYERTNQLDKAEKIYRDVIKDCEAIKDSALLTESLMFYSQVLTKQNKFSDALKVSNDALALARKINTLDMVKTAITLHAENLHNAGNDKDAYLYEMEVADMLQSRFKDDLNKKISESEAAFKNAELKHEKEVAVLKAQKEKQVYLLSFIGLLAVAGFIGYYLFQKRNSRQQKDLQLARIQSLVDGEEKERTRIARDLHDGIVQELTVIKMQLKEGIGMEGNSDKTVILNSMDLLDKASREVRDISYQMMPATLTQIGFIPAIEDMLKRVLAPVSIEYDFEHIGITGRLPEKIELSIFRITQELLNNVLKHSKADFVSLLITAKDNMITMIFEDNGIGFDANIIHKGIGLNSLTSRVQLLNGDIKYENASGTGTVVIIKLPVSTGIDS